MPQITTSPAILAAAKRAIEQLLRFKGFEVQLVPKAGIAVQKPGGGTDYVPGVRPTQTIALAQLGEDQILDAETDGQPMVIRAYALTGRSDMAIEVDDTWSDAAADYRVESVDQTSGFKTSASVVGHVRLSNG